MSNLLPEPIFSDRPPPPPTPGKARTPKRLKHPTNKWAHLAREESPNMKPFTPAEIQLAQDQADLEALEATLPPLDELLEATDLTTRDKRLDELKEHYVKCKFFFDKGGREGPGYSKSMRDTLVLIDELSRTTEPGKLDAVKGRGWAPGTIPPPPPPEPRRAPSIRTSNKGGGDRSGKRRRGKNT